ncbi:MAG: molybdopterin converting factor subunit 1 [Acidobacteria bacterium]|nr:MAG: molybdopterin converting factor subunit 1 [Acidobacteriota bacterium]PYQ17900.1 MAG: molybdopterin converting factor subunit 1 [Acidobacteriota bacterium]
MVVRVRLFASLREATGKEFVELELPEGATAEEAWRRLAADHPILADRRRSLAVAVNRRYARFEEPLPPGAEVVFVPPVSGG